MPESVRSLDWMIHRYRSATPLKTLLYLYQPDLDKLALSVFFYIVKHSPEWIRPVVLANVIDIISDPNQGSLRALWINAAVLAIAVAQNIPNQYLHIRFLSTASRNLEMTLRGAVVQRLQQLSIGFYQQRSTGVLQSKVLRDVEEIQQLTAYLFQFMPAALLNIGVAIAVTALRAPVFVLFFVGTVPVAAILVQTLRGAIRRRNAIFRQRREGLSARLIEMVKLIPVTRAHGAEAVEAAHIDQRLGAVRQAARRLDTINAVTGAVAWVVLRLFNLGCLLLAAWFVYTQQFGLTVGDVVLLTGYFDALTSAVIQILTVLPQMGTGFESIRSVGEILECPDLERNQGKQRVRSVRGDFCFECVSFTYPDVVTPAIQHFSLSVQAGETLAIVGPSGAGKSTLLSLVIGFVQPTRGQILLDGQPMQALDLRTYRQFLAVVTQETVLFEGTIRDNILYGAAPSARLEASASQTETHLWQAIEDANALEFIERLPEGLDTAIGENGVKLSGGQRQRLAIARALIRNPRVLVLDEATASLDTASEALIQQALQQLMRNRTTFVVAHRLSTIRKADRIAVMQAGQLVEIGTHDELLANADLYSKLHALQRG
ncbi:MAG: ABC transporter ATP-binding protein [Cyanobacteria bacterium P01_A01_bin.114]